MAAITLQHISKTFLTDRRSGKPAVKAVEDFSIEIADREFIVIVGPSGCGKTTVLRLIAGLEEADEGEIIIDGVCVNEIEPKDRDVAMVFQNYALYPHMTAYENIAFALEKRIPSKREIDRKVRETAELLEITEYLDRKPANLSGGQKQRIAIGRAIVRDPKVMLMDEPLSNLDLKLRTQMRAELIRLREKINTTFIYVTHDQTESMTLGDRIIVMNKGRIRQIGDPRAIYESPADLFTAGFIGAPRMNFFDAIPREISDSFRMPENAVLGVRPENLILSESGIPAKVLYTEMTGSSLHLHLDHDGKEVILLSHDKDANCHLKYYAPGDNVFFTIPPKAMLFFDRESGMLQNASLRNE